MRIEVSVPGISKERGKLPAPTALGALELAVSLAAEPPICDQLVGPALCEPVTTEAGVPVATRAPSQHRNDQERDYPPAPVTRQRQTAAFTWRQTAARCSVPAACVA
jgi:hypothetical protein